MKDFFKRKIVKKIERLMLENQVVVMTGMRRVGKTTILKYFFEGVESVNKIYLDLEDAFTRGVFNESNYENIKRSLELLGISFDIRSYIFIDEIQYIPSISSVIKYLYDKYDTKFVVTGSSSYYIKNHFTESLAGRKFIIEIFPLDFNEFLDFKKIEKISLDTFEQKNTSKNELTISLYKDLYLEYIRFGGFPEIVLNNDQEIKTSILKDIINSYFQIDITTLADFADVTNINKLLQLLTQRIGRKINISNLSNTLNLKKERIYEYLELLKSTYVINTISQESSIDNKVSANDKLYFNDTGIANTLGDVSTGSQFENSIYMNLNGKFDLTYYQSDSGNEIDFIINKKIALEVKETPTQADFANLEKRSKKLEISNKYIVGLNGSEKTNNLIYAWDL